MGERRYVYELYSRATAPADDELKRLVEHKDRMVALLRAGRRPLTPAGGGYRSRYAARLWALAHAEWSEAEPAEAGHERAPLAAVSGAKGSGSA